MKMQAVLITCYKDKSNLIRLVKSFKDEMNVYIHIDLKSKEISESDLDFLNFKNLQIIKKYNIVWGSFSHLLAIIDLMKMAANNSENKFIHIVSGQDYKIKTNQYFYKRFDGDQNFYSYILSQDEIPLHVTRRYTRGIFSSHFSILDEKVKKINDVFSSVNAKNKIGEFKKIYKGTIWSSMSMEICKFVLDYIENNPGYLDDLKHCFIPEEFFFQTIIMNSKYCVNAVPDSLRYMDWTLRNGSDPAILDETDFNKFEDSENIFIRKVDTNISHNLLELIDKQLLGEPEINKVDLKVFIGVNNINVLPSNIFEMIDRYDDFLSLSDLFELFYDITEFSRVWEDDNMVNYEKLLNFFDLILEEFDLYPIQNFK